MKIKIYIRDQCKLFSSKGPPGEVLRGPPGPPGTPGYGSGDFISEDGV
jgi:hypothetical protein